MRRLCLCQPLVRPPARLGAGVDFERQLSGRGDLAAGLRARDRLCRLAAYDAVLRGVRAPASSCPLALIVLQPPPESPHHATRARGRRAYGKIGHGLAAQSGLRAPDVRDLHLLRADVDAAGASRRFLQRSRHQRRPWRGDGVGAARHGILEPAGLGRDIRSDRRPLHYARRIGVSDRRHGARSC